MALTFITWLWGDKYGAPHIRKLAAAVKRNYDKPHRFLVFSNVDVVLPKSIEVAPIANPELIGRGCFCRLRMFDPQWQAWHGLTEPFVSLDLDLVITGKLDNVFEARDTFRILQGVNAANPNPFNASLMQLTPGYHSEVWQSFSPERAAQIPRHDFPDDQGWLWVTLPNAKGWKPGPESGVYAFQKPGWPAECKTTLPANARVVAFFGWRKPEAFASLPWVREHWRE
jgi:hypothetical protein